MLLTLHNLPSSSASASGSRAGLLPQAVPHTCTGSRIFDVTLLPDSVSSWISISSQLVAVARTDPAVSSSNVWVKH